MCIKLSQDVFSGILLPGVWKNNLKKTVREDKQKIWVNWQSFVIFKMWVRTITFDQYNITKNRTFLNL